MPMRRPRSIAALRLAAPLLGLLAAPAAAAAATITVDSSLQIEAGKCTLTSAILAANTDAAVEGCPAGSGGDVVVVPSSLSPYQLGASHPDALDGDIGPSGLPAVATTMTIRGDLEDTPSVIERAGASPPAFRILHVTPAGSLTLENLVIQGGDASDADCTPFAEPGCASGGGILNRGGTLALDNTHVTGNTSSLDGGGIASVVVEGTLPVDAPDPAVPVTTLVDSRVSANGSFSFGGGIHNEGSLTLTRSTVDLNTHEFDGAGIANVPSFFFEAPAMATLEDSAVDRNTALSTEFTTVGAGIFNGDGATLIVRSSTISRNSGPGALGGGLFNNDDAVATFVNSTVSGNSAVEGGGIYNAVNATLNVSHTTITDNSATGKGGGILNDGQPAVPEDPPFPAIPEAEGTVTMRNTILAGNSAPAGPDCSTTTDPVGEITSEGHNLVGDTAGCAVTAGTGDQIGGGASPTIDPRLAALAGGFGPTETHTPLADSPAIDTGDCTVVGGGTIDVDQQGRARPVGAQCDVGSVEADTAVSTALDDFMCYKSLLDKAFPFTPPPAVALTTVLESGLFEVKKPVALCAPAVRGGGEANDDETHLVGFQIGAAKGAPKPAKYTNLTVENAVEVTSDLALDTTKVDRLLVPASKCLGAGCPSPAPDFGAHEVDHYECAAVKVSKGAPKFPKGLTVSARDQFTGGAILYDVKKATRLCLAADKNSEAAKNPDTHLMCFQAKRAKGQGKHAPVSAALNDQFGVQRLVTKGEEEFCVPSTLSTAPAE